MKLGTSEDTQEGADVTDGWDYKSYLRMLLFLENGDHLTMRTLDRVEQNLIYEKDLLFSCRCMCNKAQTAKPCSDQKRVIL